MVFTPVNLDLIEDVELGYILKNNKIIDKSETRYYHLSDIVNTLNVDSKLISFTHPSDEKQIEGSFYRSSQNTVLFISSMSQAEETIWIESYVGDFSFLLTDYTVINNAKYFIIYVGYFELSL